MYAQSWYTNVASARSVCKYGYMYRDLLMVVFLRVPSPNLTRWITPDLLRTEHGLAIILEVGKLLICIVFLQCAVFAIKNAANLFLTWGDVTDRYFSFVSYLVCWCGNSTLGLQRTLQQKVSSRVDLLFMLIPKNKDECCDGMRTFVTVSPPFLILPSPRSNPLCRVSVVTRRS